MENGVALRTSLSLLALTKASQNLLISLPKLLKIIESCRIPSSSRHSTSILSHLGTESLPKIGRGNFSILKRWASRARYADCWLIDIVRIDGRYWKSSTKGVVDPWSSSLDVAMLIRTEIGIQAINPHCDGAWQHGWWLLFFASWCTRSFMIHQAASVKEPAHTKHLSSSEPKPASKEAITQPVTSNPSAPHQQKLFLIRPMPARWQKQNIVVHHTYCRPAIFKSLTLDRSAPLTIWPCRQPTIGRISEHTSLGACHITTEQSIPELHGELVGSKGLHQGNSNEPNKQTSSRSETT